MGQEVEKKEMVRQPKSIEKLQLELKQTLDSLQCLQVVQASSRGKDIRVLCRCPDKAAWLKILYRFLEQESGKGWYSFIGQKYMLMNGNLTAAWVLIFEAEDLDAAVQDIRKMFADIRADEIGGPKNLPASEVSVPLPSGGLSDRLLGRILDSGTTR